MPGCGRQAGISSAAICSFMESYEVAVVGEEGQGPCSKFEAIVGSI